MDRETLAEMAAESVAAALRRKEEENTHLKEVLGAFGKTLIEQARWKAVLPEQSGLGIATLDPSRFEKGIPITDRSHLMRLGELWKAAAERLIPSLEEGFPKIWNELERLRLAMADGFSPDDFLEASFGGRNDDAGKIAEALEIGPEILFFALYQIAKPIIEKRAESLLTLPKSVSWNKGYCYICGSFPEMSLLREKEGKRWLHCGFCGATWRFHRTTCPFCDTHEPDDKEFFFVEGREHETAQACHRCKRYLNSVDTRNMVDVIAQEVLDISLMHLDAVVQQKGFKPMKGIGWKSVQ